MDTESFFKGKRPIGQKLKAFGFCERGDDLFFARPVGDGSLRLEISVGKDLERAAVHTRVVDPDTGEEYVLHLVDDAQGAFCVGLAALPMTDSPIFRKIMGFSEAVRWCWTLGCT